MRKLIFFITIFILTSCSNTPQQKAEKMVKKYLQDKLDDPASYESAEFGKLLPLYAAFEEVPGKNKLLYYEKELAESELQKWENVKEQDIQHVINDSIKYYRTKFNEIKEKYNKAQEEYLLSDRLQTGWTIEHTFRANNKFGAKIKNKYYFILNNDFTVKSYIN